jgi:hypothetical protein
MLVVSLQEFTTNQKKYIGLVEKGEEVMLKSNENENFAPTSVTEYISTTIIPQEYILEPDSDLTRAITGEELLNNLIPRVEKLFDK